MCLLNCTDKFIFNFQLQKLSFYPVLMASLSLLIKACRGKSLHETVGLTPQVNRLFIPKTSVAELASFSFFSI